MLQIKAKIKASSKWYKYGLNHKKRAVWLSVLDFRPTGKLNFKLMGVKDITGTNIVFMEIWLPFKDVKLQQFDDDQLSLFEDSITGLNENKNF